MHIKCAVEIKLPSSVSVELSFLHVFSQDFLSASTDLQEVLQLDPNVQEAEQELEMVTNLLRESLLANAQGKNSH